MPLGANPCHLSTWKPVIFNIRARLGSWKGKLLSVAGRICLIKAVINSIPLCCMFVFLLPKGVLHSISAMTRRFLWSGCSDRNKVCKVAWNKAIREKKAVVDWGWVLSTTKTWLSSSNGCGILIIDGMGAGRNLLLTSISLVLKMVYPLLITISRQLGMEFTSP